MTTPFMVQLSVVTLLLLLLQCRDSACDMKHDYTHHYCCLLERCLVLTRAAPPLLSRPVLCL
jgi:hypothetical protein